MTWKVVYEPHGCDFPEKEEALVMLEDTVIECECGQKWAKLCDHDEFGATWVKCEEVPTK